MLNSFSNVLKCCFIVLTEIEVLRNKVEHPKLNSRILFLFISLEFHVFIQRLKISKQELFNNLSFASIIIDIGL
jgi:hypothetical protein